MRKVTGVAILFTIKIYTELLYGWLLAGTPTAVGMAGEFIFFSPIIGFFKFLFN